MKKILLISTITIIIGVFAINPYWFRFMWGPQLLLLPLTAGILMVLIQNENRSYKFIPKLIAGSLLTGFIGTFFIQLTDYFIRGQVYNQSFVQSMNPLYVIDLSLILSAVCIFGGLVGIAIKGAAILLLKNKKHEKI
jgi:flagellar biosynthesis protein FliQ